jgi:hypothetical protein
MTWTIEMSSKELARKTEVERALDHRITQTAAASKLGISEHSDASCSAIDRKETQDWYQGSAENQATGEWILR